MLEASHSPKHGVLHKEGRSIESRGRGVKVAYEQGIVYGKLPGSGNALSKLLPVWKLLQ